MRWTHERHRKRVDAQLKDGEDRSEKKKNEVRRRLPPPRFVTWTSLTCCRFCRSSSKYKPRCSKLNLHQTRRRISSFKTTVVLLLKVWKSADTVTHDLGAVAIRVGTSPHLEAVVVVANSGNRISAYINEVYGTRREHFDAPSHWARVNPSHDKFLFD